MSKLEDTLLFHMRANRLPEPEREYMFAKDIKRRWRFDFAWPKRKLAVEVEGGIWVGGAHTRGRHFNSDADKYNHAALTGWKVLRFSTNHISDGNAVLTIKKALDLDKIN